VKLQAGKEHELVAREKAEICRFLIADAPLDDEAGQYEGENSAARSYLEYQQRKKARTVLTSFKYRTTHHIFRT
jgi:ABC-type sulfate transport system substrate-binding protein